MLEIVGDMGQPLDHGVNLDEDDEARFEPGSSGEGRAETSQTAREAIERDHLWEA